MSSIKCIIIEDEPLAAKVLTDYIALVPFLQLQGVFKNALLALDFLREHTTELIFLDIHLPKLKGIDFLKTVTHPHAVIMTTAYHDYAVQGFELNVTDYLLKPFSFERFLAAVNKVHSAQLTIKEPTGSSEQRDFIFVNAQKKKVKILFSELLYIESQKEYIKIVTTGKQQIVKMSTHEIESLLPRDQFIRIHRSYIVSMARIESYTAEVVEVNGVSLPIGREYKGVLDRLR
jgi:two-component system LytT family response regulator